MKFFKNNLTAKQNKLLVKLVSGMTIVAIVFLIFVDNGLLDYYKNTKLIEELQVAKEELEDENAKLEDNVKKLDSDPRYIEKIARENHGLLKPNEKVYDFHEPEKDTKKDKK